MLQENKDVRMFQVQINTVHSATMCNEESININMYNREIKQTTEKKIE